MAADEEPDLCVIGGGAAGHAVALAAAALGARCTLIDPAERLGRGQAAELAEAMFLREAIGGRAAQPLDWPGFRRRLGQALAADHTNHTAARLATLGATVIRGTARFADTRTIRVNGTAIRARRFVLATGAVPRGPAWAAGLAPGRLLRPADLLACDTLPAAVGIVATVPAGLAWAQALARLGTAVTLSVEPGARAVFDPELMQPVLDALRKDGVTLVIRTSASATCPLDGPVLLVAGRTEPATVALGLPEAGIACRSGAPVVDRRLRTTNPRVHALGEVLGPEAMATGALGQQVGRVLRTALFRLPVAAALPPAPVTLWTDPPLAQVGLLLAGTDLRPAIASEAKPSSLGVLRTDRWLVTALRASQGRLNVGRSPEPPGTGPHNGRLLLRFPLAESNPGTPGLVKIATSQRGRIHGVGLVGPGAPEAIAPWVLAIARGVPVGAMAAIPVPPGTLAETGRRAALGFVSGRLLGPWIRRLLAALRRLP